MTVDQPAPIAPPLTVNRWRRFGHDRAYVKAGERDLGFRDLLTGDVHPADDSDTNAILAATRELYVRAQEARRASEYRPRHSRAESGDPVPTEPQPTVFPPQVVSTSPEPAGSAAIVPATIQRPATAPKHDLATNRPGQSARAKARELREAAPVRTFFDRVVGAKTDERAWRIGADGEADVGRWLERLGTGWRVLHAVPVGDRGSDIDHVVIGPGGVFTVNTKHHPDASVWIGGDVVKINGQNVPYVHRSRHEARRASELLGAAAGTQVEVLGVLAFVSVRGRLTVKRQPADVAVVAGNRIAAMLRNADPVLDADTVERIYAVARDLDTWQPRTAA